MCWVGENDGLAKRGNGGVWREGAHQYPVMAARESYSNRNAEITQGRQVYFLAFLIHAGKQLGKKSLLEFHFETGTKSCGTVNVSGPSWIKLSEWSAYFML